MHVLYMYYTCIIHVLYMRQICIYVTMYIFTFDLSNAKLQFTNSDFTLTKELSFNINLACSVWYWNKEGCIGVVHGCVFKCV